MTEMAFGGAPLNRQAELRTDASAISALRADARAVAVQVAGDALATHANCLALVKPVQDAVFLGTAVDGTPWFAQPCRLPAGAPTLRDLLLAGTLSTTELAIAAQARSLVDWHQRHRFCARCGTPTALADAGYRRHCAACGADHFPRTDPVVIMAVHHGSDLLLGRQAPWPQGMYSTLAGFMEPGETIEEAVRREVAEEAGIAVGAVRYVASQPWPFPSSLMIGVVAEAQSRTLKLDPVELQDARWFSPSECRQMLARTHPDGLYAAHPYAIAYHLLRQALDSLAEGGRA